MIYSMISDRRKQSEKTLKPPAGVTSAGSDRSGSKCGSEHAIVHWTDPRSLTHTLNAKSN